MGFFARVWEYGSLPPGLAEDEASDGVEAMSLARYGMDRNGVSFPVRFISWGSGQDVLDSYILIPLVAVFGLSSKVVRFPVLVSGIISLPLIFFLGLKLRGRVFGLLAMFLLAISPWHIALSRWGLDANLLPFFFLLGFTCLLLSDSGNHWFVMAGLVFGLGLYTYINSYLAIPLFLLLVLPFLYQARRIAGKDLLAGLLIFIIMAAPLVLYVLVNTFNWPSIHLGPLSVPRFPSVSRVQTDIVLFQPDPLAELFIRMKGFLTLLITQNDTGFDQPGFGYLYKFSFPLIFAGGYLFFYRKDGGINKHLILSWLLAAFAVGLLIHPGFTHDIVVFTPLILLCAVFLEWLMNWNKRLFILALGIFLVAFTVFTGYYHGPEYKAQVDRKNYTGLLSAIDYAKTSTGAPICISSPVLNHPYIYVLFSEQMDPSVGPEKIKYINPQAQFRQVSSVGRYFFGLENCPVETNVTYIHFFNDPPPAQPRSFTIRRFGLFTVFLSK